jgi:iron complex outermembrane receptor protein
LALLAGDPARAQTTLPTIVVTAPSPIARQGQPPRRAPAAAAAVPAEQPAPLQGTLPVVTDQFATVSVVPAEEILRTPGGSLGDLLFSKPGVTGSSFAPGGSSRPVVRGLDNYRIRIQENGLATNDVSDLSEDHAVPVDPLAARQIEVIRGPATLRWGSQAIGGVVNVENNRIPTMVPPRGYSSELNGALTSVDRGREGSLLLDAGQGNFAIHADAFGRRAEDYAIPGYPYLFPPDPAPPVNGRQPNSFMRSNGASVGGSYVLDRGFVGVAVTDFKSFYGIPGIEATGTNTRIDMRQTKVMSKGEFRPENSVVDAVRFWAGATDYKHDELANEGGFDGVQQTFTNKAQEGRLEVQFAPFDVRFAALTTAVGVQGSRQKLTAPGAGGGGLFDPNESTSAAAYMFNEFRFTDAFRMQLSGRIENAKVSGAAPDFPADFLPTGADPDGMSHSLSFTPKSAAIGFLHDLPYGLVASVNAQYVERAPRAPELFSRGPHEATATFEIGNPNLTIESAQSVEIGLRRASGPFRFEATAYHTSFRNFIFKRLTGNTCDGEFASCIMGPGGELNQIVYSQRDALFRGGEIQAQLDVAPLWGGMFGVDGQYDIVRATFTDGTNVPRIPPQRLGGGLFWRDQNLFARVGLLHAFAHNDIADNETPTPGYDLLKAELSYVQKLRDSGYGPREIQLGVTGTNLLDDDVRNSVSFKKDEVLLPGRSVRVFARVKL